MRKLVLAAGFAIVASLLNAEICIKNGDAIAFMGDSITQQGNSSPVGYVNLVIRGLEVCGVNAKKIPAGISGHKSNNMLARLDKDVISKKPRWMTFSCGVNDVWHGAKGVELEDYKANVTKILDKCAAAGVEVIVLTATMIGENPEGKNNKKLAAYNDWLREESKRRKLRLADLNADMQALLAEIRKTDKTPGAKITRDGVHMAYKGNCMMAWGVLKAMGVDEAKKDEIFSAFDKIPGAVTCRVYYSISEYNDIKAKAKAAGKRDVDYIKSSSLK
jgi:lysophospholipase L1-like esterase